MVERVVATAGTLALIRALGEQHGGLTFHQPGDCGDGGAVRCVPRRTFAGSEADMLLGEIGGCPVYVGHAQFERLQHAQLVLDVAGDAASAWQLPPEEIAFRARLRRFSTEEWAELSIQPPHAWARREAAALPA